MADQVIEFGEIEAGVPDRLHDLHKPERVLRSIGPERIDASQINGREEVLYGQPQLPRQDRMAIEERKIAERKLAVRLGDQQRKARGTEAENGL